MIRRVAFEFLLFLAPFALYALYLRVAAVETGTGAAGMVARKHPWTALFASGLILVAASFVILGLIEGDPATGVYVPPHLDKGVVVPGHVESAHVETGDAQ